MHADFLISAFKHALCLQTCCFSLYFKGKFLFPTLLPGCACSTFSTQGSRKRGERCGGAAEVPDQAALQVQASLTASIPYSHGLPAAHTIGAQLLLEK